VIIAAPIAILDWEPIPAVAWLPLISLGVVQGLSQVLVAGAYLYAPAEKVGPFIYSVIVFTALIDWIVWDHVPTLFVYVGMALVIGGGVIAIRAKRAQEPSLSAQGDTTNP
jgi:drug/metabolite transporter (DMT)-like permease